MNHRSYPKMERAELVARLDPHLLDALLSVNVCTHRSATISLVTPSVFRSGVTKWKD